MARPDRTPRDSGADRSRRPQIDARQHLAALAGQTLHGVLDGLPHRILGVTRDEAYVITQGAPLGKPIPIADVQAAFDRLAEGEEIQLSDASLGENSAFLAAVMLSLPGAELLHGPARIRSGNGEGRTQ